MERKLKAVVVARPFLCPVVEESEQKKQEFLEYVYKMVADLRGYAYGSCFKAAVISKGAISTLTALTRPCSIPLGYIGPNTAIKADNFRMKDEEIVCDIDVLDTPMGRWLAAQPAECVFFNMYGTFGAKTTAGFPEGQGMVMHGMPENFGLMEINVGVTVSGKDFDIPHYRNPSNYEQIHHQLSIHEYAFDIVAEYGGIPPNTEIIYGSEDWCWAFMNAGNDHRVFLTNVYGLEDPSDPTEVLVPKLHPTLPSSACLQALYDEAALRASKGPEKVNFTLDNVIIFNQTEWDTWIFDFDRGGHPCITRIAKDKSCCQYADLISLYINSRKATPRAWLGRVPYRDVVFSEIKQPDGSQFKRLIPN